MSTRTEPFAVGAFDRAALERHLAAFEDLPWLQDLKRRYYQDFELTPMPLPSDEKWRFAHLAKVSLEAYAPASTEATKASAEEAWAQKCTLAPHCAGRMVFVDNQLCDFQEVPPELARQGVIWMPLDRALREHPDIVRKYFLEEANRLGSDKWLYLHNAFFQSGTLLYVPKGVEIDRPLLAYYWSGQSGATMLPHTLVIAEDQARVNFVDCYGSLETAADKPCLSIGAGTVYAGPGARVYRQNVQNFARNALSFQLEANIADRDASVQTIGVNLGAAYARLENQTRIIGPGADVKMYSLTVATGEQEFDQRTLQIHEAPHATSDLLFKNALTEQSRTIFSGLILVEKNAQKTDAYQTNRNLLLEPTAEACSLPGLEIEANDVKCSHGATTGQVDERELFYMMSRGISKKEAHKLLVFGFFEEIIDKVEFAELKDNVRTLVQAKFHRGH